MSNGAGQAILRPYRYSELGRTPEGNRRLMIRAANPDPAGPDLRTLMSRGKVITPDEVAGWFAQLSFTPTNHELDELAYALNLIRVTKPKEEAVPLPPELDRVAKALTSLSTDVPVLMRMQLKAVDEAGPTAVARDVLRRAKLVLDLGSLLSIIQTLQIDPFMVPAGPRHRTALWHRDLQWIAFLLLGIAKKHQTPLGVTKWKCPGVEFLQTALARAGIHTDNQAIAKEMARAAKDKLPIIYMPDD